ncbi:MAG TPA: hypothetical protein VMF06_09030, partial [Candidatus Limnocylindria bacterium]|nr:hypothetical protein [Candidatus Limnocylindria bacterium]
TRDGKLNLSVDVGILDAEVTVTLHVKSSQPTEEVDSNGWPIGFFDQIAGSMPELRRAPQGAFEARLPLE